MSGFCSEQFIRTLNCSRQLMNHICKRGNISLPLWSHLQVLSTHQRCQTRQSIVSSPFSTSSKLNKILSVETFDESKIERPKWYKEEGRHRWQGPYNEVSPEVSQQYLESDAFNNVYGDEPVWLHYRRNFKGHLQPSVREKCTSNGLYKTGNPCPVCRDNYLRIHYKNPKLLLQFCEGNTLNVRDNNVTGVCKKQQKNIMKHLAIAVDRGTIEAPLPFRTYDYDHYRKMAGLDSMNTDTKSRTPDS